MISSIKIERFKNIDELEVPLGGLTVLIGSNNSGKSTIQQAIQFTVSVAQTTKYQKARWLTDEKCPTSISSEDLIYTPLRDVEALAPNGRLRVELDHAIKVTFNDETTNANVTIRKGKNKNISTAITGKTLGEKLQDIENPFSIIVPGLAGIPAYEEYKPPSIVRKAAARGDANSVFRNILLLLSQNAESWRAFIAKFNALFPDYSITVSFDKEYDEQIHAKVEKNEITLPIDACGTGILQSIQILAYYYLYKPKLLILDEPDSHLHPNNQRILAKLLRTLNDETGCQIIISTHSRHLLEELTSHALIHWVNAGNIVESTDDLARRVLLDIGALDRGDMLRDGNTKCVLLTEDTDTSYIKALALSSGFMDQEFQIWSYKCCTNINVALALNSFITDHAPATRVVVHRDKDYMSQEEIDEYREKLEPLGIDVFITLGNDAESYFVTREHITHVYQNVSIEQASILLNESLDECRIRIIEKMINTRHMRQLHASYSGAHKPNPGLISTQCTQEFDQDPASALHGKIIEKCIRNKLQPMIGGVIKLCVESPFLNDATLRQIANRVWQ
ncbi:ATP-dependent nuclease [Aeromonas dhakensis]|uniref:ATP-dependent nuclease n=1 Tax=Aeromonas dhakensis TaxID=196024 RepID=UPI00300DE267